jgi:hypothetical protein
MFRKLALIAAVSALLLVAIAPSALAWAQKGGWAHRKDGVACGGDCQIVAGSLSDEEAAGLIFMREEEKLAGDIYRAFYEMWGHQVFSNIAAAEDRHTAAVAGLLDRYGIDDPAAGLGAGEFADASLQALYDELLARGAVSLQDALEVGVLIEQTDIADLQERLTATDEPAIVRVYTNLLHGSQQHLAAFQQVLAADGGECVPAGNGTGAGGTGRSGGSGMRHGPGR